MKKSNIALLSFLLLISTLSIGQIKDIQFTNQTSVYKLPDCIPSSPVEGTRCDASAETLGQMQDYHCFRGLVGVKVIPSLIGGNPSDYLFSVHLKHFPENWIYTSLKGQLLDKGTIEDLSKTVLPTCTDIIFTVYNKATDKLVFRKVQAFQDLENPIIWNTKIPNVITEVDFVNTIGNGRLGITYDLSQMSDLLYVGDELDIPNPGVRVQIGDYIEEDFKRTPSKSVLIPADINAKLKDHIQNNAFSWRMTFDWFSWTPSLCGKTSIPMKRPCYNYTTQYAVGRKADVFAELRIVPTSRALVAANNPGETTNAPRNHSVDNVLCYEKIKEGKELTGFLTDNVLSTGVSPTEISWKNAISGWAHCKMYWIDKNTGDTIASANNPDLISMNISSGTAPGMALTKVVHPTKDTEYEFGVVFTDNCNNVVVAYKNTQKIIVTPDLASLKFVTSNTCDSTMVQLTTDIPDFMKIYWNKSNNPYKDFSNLGEDFYPLNVPSGSIPPNQVGEHMINKKSIAVFTRYKAQAIKVSAYGEYAPEGCLTEQPFYVNTYPSYGAIRTSRSSICLGDTFNILGFDLLSYKWKGESIVSNTNDIIKAAPKNDIATYHLKGIDEKGCINYHSIDVYVNTLQGDLQTNNVEVCEGGTIGWRDVLKSQLYYGNFKIFNASGEFYTDYPITKKDDGATWYLVAYNEGGECPRAMKKPFTVKIKNTKYVTITKGAYNPQTNTTQVTVSLAGGPAQSSIFPIAVNANNWSGNGFSAPSVCVLYKPNSSCSFQLQAGDWLFTIIPANGACEQTAELHIDSYCRPCAPIPCTQTTACTPSCGLPESIEAKTDPNDRITAFLVWAFSQGNYNTNITVIPYTQGDLNGDGLFDPSDLVVLYTSADDPSCANFNNTNNGSNKKNDEDAYQQVKKWEQEYMHYGQVNETTLDAVPNPFNSSTNVLFSLKDAAFVNIELHSIEGKKLEAIVANQYLEAGYHTSAFTAGENFAKGIYYLILQTNNEVITKKVIITK